MFTITLHTVGYFSTHKVSIRVLSTFFPRLTWLKKVSCHLSQGTLFWHSTCQDLQGHKREKHSIYPLSYLTGRSKYGDFHGPFIPLIRQIGFVCFLQDFFIWGCTLLQLPSPSFCLFTFFFVIQSSASVNQLRVGVSLFLTGFVMPHN